MNNIPNIIEKTESICPVCKNIIPADIVDEEGRAYMVKECSEHGRFKAVVAKHTWYYKGLSSLYNRLFPNGHPIDENSYRNLTIHPTSRCNLSCSICYADSLSKIYGEPSLKEIEDTIKKIKGRKIVSILGGEPSMREDIFEIIKLFHQAGHYIEFFTNGIKLKDFSYVRRLRSSGADIVHINISTLSDESVYAKMDMGDNALKDKIKVLSNLKKARMSTGIIDVVTRGLNEDYIEEVTEFCRNNRFIKELSIRGYSHIGKLGFVRNHEFTMDGLAEEFIIRTKGLLTLEEFYMFQKMIYILRYIFDNRSQCYVNQSIFIPRTGKKIRDILPPDKILSYIKIFEDMVPNDPARAKFYFLGKIIPRMTFLGAKLSLQNMLSKKIGFFSSRYYMPLEFCMFYNPYNLDIKKARERCSSAWWHSYEKGKFDGYCKILASTSCTDER